MTNNNQQPLQENPNNQFSSNEPMTFAQKVEYVKSTEMTNIKQQTAVEWFSNESLRLIVKLENKEISTGEYAVSYVELLFKSQAMDKEQKLNMFNCGRQYQVTGEGTFKQIYQEIYGGREQ